jgi:hypothetical protein
MDTEPQVDAVDALLTRAATWEPPDGYVLRVIAASRADERRISVRPRPQPVIEALARLRASMRGLAARSEGAAWTLRQYWKLLRRP